MSPLPAKMNKDKSPEQKSGKSEIDLVHILQIICLRAI